jgi:hypothetical protein
VNPQVRDNLGDNVEHGREIVNGVCLHYVAARDSESAFLRFGQEWQVREAAEDACGVVLPRGHRLAKECLEELVCGHLDFFGEG